MHASHIKKKDLNLTLNSFFEILKFTILFKKKNFFKKNFRSVFNENIDSFYDQKNTDLYLRKIQVSFEIRKKFRSIFKEITDQFCV